MQWGQGTSPSSLAQSENCSPFEVSGQFLSSTHAVLEDITSGHSDMVVTLCGRAEVSWLINTCMCTHNVMYI